MPLRDPNIDKYLLPYQTLSGTHNLTMCALYNSSLYLIYYTQNRTCSFVKKYIGLAQKFINSQCHNFTT